MLKRICLAIILLTGAGAAVLQAAESDINWKEELNTLKSRINELETRLAAQEGVSEEQKEILNELGSVADALGNLEFGVGVTAVVQDVHGATQALNPEGNVTDATISLDLELGAELWEGASAFLLVEAGNGDGIDSDIATLSGLNDDADDDPGLHLTEAWLEQRWLDECVALKVGKIGLTGPVGHNECGFDANALANDETSQFLSSGFVNNITIEFPEDNGFGLDLWVSPSDMIDIGFGIAEADSDWDDCFNSLFYIGEIDFKLNPMGRPGTYRFYYWRNELDHVRLDDADSDQNAGEGYGLSFDQEINDWLAVFGRYGAAEEEIYMVSDAWSVGVQCSGELWGREKDVLAVAYGVAELGDDGRDIIDLEIGDPKDEVHIEAYYNFFVNDHLQITADIQYLQNSLGTGENDDIWVFGLRSQLGF